MHEGPLHAVLGDDVRVAKSSVEAAAVFDPFDGMPTYTQKYRKKRSRIPRLNDRPYGRQISCAESFLWGLLTKWYDAVLRFFPEELRQTLDPNYGTDNKPVKKKKLDLMAGSKRLSRLDELEDEAEQKGTGDEAEKGDDDLDDDEDAQDDEDRDTDFENDEDDNDDYNAENYFDDGEDDYNDGGDGGGGEDY